jgi:3-methyladenine DNA glycosylase AlkC
MAPKLKDFFDAALIRGIARDLRAAHPRLDQRAFVAACLDGLEDLELTERAGRVAEVMRRCLPADFEQAADVLVRSLGPELTRTEQFGMAPFRYLPHVLYVGRYGLEAFEPSMRAQYELTKRFSAEWSIRGFLIAHPEATLARLSRWVTDPNVHVRRLVSEGTRPRLPWAPRLRAFQEDPGPVLGLLEWLKDDSERYVQRSVANNLNDIGKDHPALATEVCRRWSADASPARRWIVGHALRSLIKRGDRRALATLGYAAAPKIEIVGTSLQPPRVKVGASLRLSFELVSKAQRPQELLVDYAVHFVKADGARRPKTFKLRKLNLPPRGRVRLESRVSFARLTTRTPRPGRHLVEAIVNGVVFPLGAFDVVG